MRAPNFKDFITEQKENKLRILCLSADPENSEYFHTAKRIKVEGPKLGHEVYIVFIDGAYIKNEDGIKTIHNEGDEKGFEINDTNTVAIVRGSITQKDSWLDLLSQLEKAGVSCINNRSCVNLCADKYRSYLRLADYGLVQPHTVLIPNKKGVETAFENLDRKYPIIMKTLRGSKGIGVIFIESERSLDAIVQLIYKESEDAELLLQEYIKTDYDIRVLVLGGKVLAAMRRDVIKGDFRSNFSRGGKVKMFKLTELEIEDCILAAKAVNGHYVAVDFIPSQNREKDRPYIIEVNSSPGTEGIESATGENLIKQVIQHFEDKKLRHKTPTECGRVEVVTLEGVGDVSANFDTGNSARVMIHADEMEVKNGTVFWSTKGGDDEFSMPKGKFKNKLIQMRKYERGAVNATTFERPMIHMDITFLGTTYKDVECIIDDRTSKTTKCLMNQRFMRMTNVMINPARKYVVTTKYTLD
tara:strand:+ start:37 stop:1449 length:1413 start_codon:yes stop_codon:yes gene_type:complete